MLRYFSRSLAAALQKALAERDEKISDLAKAVGESPAFLRRMLVAEDHAANAVRIEVIAALAAELDCKPVINFEPADSVKPQTPVQSAAAK